MARGARRRRGQNRQQPLNILASLSEAGGWTGLGVRDKAGRRQFDAADVLRGHRPRWIPAATVPISYAQPFAFSCPLSRSITARASSGRLQPWLPSVALARAEGPLVGTQIGLHFRPPDSWSAHIPSSCSREMPPPLLCLKLRRRGRRVPTLTRTPASGHRSRRASARQFGGRDQQDEAKIACGRVLVRVDWIRRLWSPILTRRNTPGVHSVDRFGAVCGGRNWLGSQ